MPASRPVRGFTLVEMMLVAGILAVIGLAIASTFAGGLKIYSRMEGYTTVKTDVLLALEKIERDLRSTFYYTGISFIGDSRKVTFPGMIRRYGDKGQPEESIGSVSYYLYDAQKTKTLAREEKSYAQAVKIEGAQRGSVTSLAPVESIKFTYYRYDPEAKSYDWVNSWDKSKEDDEGKDTEKAKDGLPLGIKVEINYNDNGKASTLGRAVFLQQAVSLNRAQIKARAEKENTAEAKSEE